MAPAIGEWVKWCLLPNTPESNRLDDIANVIGELPLLTLCVSRFRLWFLRQAT